MTTIATTPGSCADRRHTMLAASGCRVTLPAHGTPFSDRHLARGLTWAAARRVLSHREQAVVW